MYAVSVIVHHALYAVCAHLFENGFIYDSYANRKAKGAASTSILLNRDSTTDIILKVINDGATVPTIEYTVRLRYRHDAEDIARVGEPAEQIVVNIRSLLEGQLLQK